MKGTHTLNSRLTIKWIGLLTLARAEVNADAQSGGLPSVRPARIA